MALVPHPATDQPALVWPRSHKWVNLGGHQGISWQSTDKSRFDVTNLVKVVDNMCALAQSDIERKPKKKTKDQVL